MHFSRVGRLSKPTMVPSPGEGLEGRSLGDHHNTIMAYSGLVTDSIGVTGRLYNDATKGQDHFTLSQLHGNSEVRSTTTSPLEGISLKSKKVANQAIELNLHSRRDMTNANQGSILPIKRYLSLFGRCFRYPRLPGSEISLWAGIQVFKLLLALKWGSTH